MGGCDSITYCKARIGAYTGPTPPAGEELALLAGQFYVSPEELLICYHNQVPAEVPRHTKHAEHSISLS